MQGYASGVSEVIARPAPLAAVKKPQPWELPAVTHPHFVRHRPPPVLVVDANVIFRDLRHAAKNAASAGEELPDSAGAVQPAMPFTALGELLQAGHARVVMSHRDLEVTPSGLPRLEARIHDKGGVYTPAMLDLWRTHLRPHVLALDPTGLPDTPESRAVRQAARDPDDADLALLVHVLKADALFTYDRAAFASLLPVLPAQGGHGAHVSTYRDQLRTDQAVSLVFGLPMTAVTTTTQAASAALSRLGVTGFWQGALVLGALGAALAHPTSRAVLADAARAVGRAWTHFTPDADMLAAWEARQEELRPVSRDSEDPVVLAARHLIRSPAPLSATALSGALRLRGPAGALRDRLAQHPGLFMDAGNRRWQMRQG